MSREYWRLEIEKENGKLCLIYGTEENLRLAYDELRAAKEMPDGTSGQKTIEVHGHTDTADRAEVTLFVLTANVESVSLTHMV